MIKKQKLYVRNIVHNMTVYDGRVRLMVNAAFTKVPNTISGKQGIKCKNGAKYEVDVRCDSLTRVLAARLIDAPRSEAELIAAKANLMNKMVADLGIRLVLDDGSENFSSMTWSIGDAGEDADHLMDDEDIAHIRKATEDALCGDIAGPEELINTEDIENAIVEVISELEKTIAANAAKGDFETIHIDALTRDYLETYLQMEDVLNGLAEIYNNSAQNEKPLTKFVKQVAEAHVIADLDLDDEFAARALTAVEDITEEDV